VLGLRQSTVRENIAVALAYGRAQLAPPVAEALIEEYRLTEVADRPAGELDSAQQKMHDLVRALAAEPKLLVMDEPSAGLSPLFVKEVLRVLGDLQGRGLSLLIAEQNIGFLEVATRVSVLEGGRIRFSGTVAEMTDSEALRRAYFGLK
jgi:branched-chain amino acid transport system ATP-binding protein